MRKSLTLLFAILCTQAPEFVLAQAVEPEAPLEEVVVSGEYAGPGMWKVTHKDHPGHVLWIVGEPPPLPKRLSWRSQKVERVALQSQEILLQPSVSIKPDEEIGIFKGLTLVPGLLKARKNPDGGKLVEQVPPEVYSRWLVQKKIYLGRDSGVEKMRPIVAANELRQAALDKLKLRSGNMVWDEIHKLVEKHKIPVNRPNITFTFKADEVRARIKEISKVKIADAECFEKTVEFTEVLSNKAVEDERAHAWATGDIGKLASLPVQPNTALPCFRAMLTSDAVADIVPADIGEQLNVLWVETAQKLLAKNQSTLSVAAIVWLLAPDGFLARMQKLGYDVQAPDQPTPEPQAL
jgi:hypothetical protein